MGSAVHKAILLILSLDKELLNILGTTARVSLSSSVLALLIGVPIGLWLGSTRFPGRSALVVVNRTLMGMPPVVCGLLTDCSYSGPIGFYVIGLVIACFAVSTAYQGYIRRSMLTVMLMAGIVIPVLLTMQFLFYYVFAGYADSGYMFLKHYVSRILYTFAMMPVYYSINQTLLVRKGSFP